MANNKQDDNQEKQASSTVFYFKMVFVGSTMLAILALIATFLYDAF